MFVPEGVGYPTGVLDDQQIQFLLGTDVYSSDGEKIGRAGQVYVDDQTGYPEWATVNTGLFGLNESFVPLKAAKFYEDRVTVPFTKDAVKDAPNVNPDGGHLGPEEEDRLYRHYGLTGDEKVSDFTSTTHVELDGRGTTGAQSPEPGRPRLRRYAPTEPRSRPR